MSDAELVERFERGDVEEFRHRDHVRVAFAYLRTMPLLEAIARFTAALRRCGASRRRRGSRSSTTRPSPGPSS